MAAETACAPARAGTILGVTRSIASPAYRLEKFEPRLRLAVPALLALFLLTLAASVFVQLRDGREEALVDAINDIDIIATLSAAKFGSRPAPMDQAGRQPSSTASRRNFGGAPRPRPHAPAGRQRGSREGGIPAPLDGAAVAQRSHRRRTAAHCLRTGPA